jgi:hypothetical protein
MRSEVWCCATGTSGARHGAHYQYPMHSALNSHPETSLQERSVYVVPERVTETKL